MEDYASPLVATLLISMRIAPTLAFAPPFTLLRVPATARVLLSVGIALWLVLADPESTTARLPVGASIIPVAAAELLLGMTMMLGLQIAFAAILMVGRALDIQVGFALAQVADPALRSQMPLIGSLLSYAAAAVFFTTGGPHSLLAIWSQSVRAAPLGAFALGTDIAPLLDYIAATFILAAGLTSLVLATIFLVDLTVAFVSRTLPQMNVLVLGFQVKTLALLLTLPFVFALLGSSFLRLVNGAIESSFGLL